MSEGLILHIRGDNELVLVEVTLPPGTSTGWHFHPGPLLVSVRSGRLTRYGSDCRSHTHQPGDLFVEPPGEDNVHNGFNDGSEPVVLLVTYVVPTGAPLRQEASAPPCASAFRSCGDQSRVGRVRRPAA